MEIILGSFMYTILQKIQKYFFKESLACLALEKLEKQLTYKKEKELHMQVNTWATINSLKRKKYSCIKSFKLFSMSMTRHLTFLHGLHKNMSMYFLDLSRVYGFKPCIFVCTNFLRYEKTNNVQILNPHPRIVKIERCVIWKP